MNHFSLGKFGVAIDADDAMGHPDNHDTINPLFNGRRDREIAHTFLAAPAGFWVGHF